MLEIEQFRRLFRGGPKTLRLQPKLFARPSKVGPLWPNELWHMNRAVSCPYCLGPLYEGPRLVDEGLGALVHLACRTAGCCSRFSVRVTQDDQAMTGDYLGQHHMSRRVPMFRFPKGTP